MKRKYETHEKWNVCLQRNDVNAHNHHHHHGHHRNGQTKTKSNEFLCYGFSFCFSQEQQQKEKEQSVLITENLTNLLKSWCERIVKIFQTFQTFACGKFDWNAMNWFVWKCYLRYGLNVIFLLCWSMLLLLLLLFMLLFFLLWSFKYSFG